MHFSPWAQGYGALLQAGGRIWVSPRVLHPRAQAEGTVAPWGMLLSWQTAGAGEAK